MFWKKFSNVGVVFLLSVNLVFAQGQVAIEKSCDIDGIKKLALGVIQSNLTDCVLQKGEKCFVAGAFWHQFWVRDTSYSSLMGLYKLYPKELKNTFKELVLMNGDKGYPDQDPASDFGRFPYQTDSVVWVIGAFELAKQTGDEDFRKYVYGVGKRMLVKWKVAEDKRDGLIFGAPSFLDSWASFPKEWQGNKKVFLKNKFLSTNVLWLRFQEILLWEGKYYGEISDTDFEKRLESLRGKIRTLNEKFLNSAGGYYNYYIGSSRYEGLGNALIQKFHFNSSPVTQIQTDEDFYPAHYPMFDFIIPGNWYSDTAQHVWVDRFVAIVDKEPVADFCRKYGEILLRGNDIAELVQGGKMFGGSKQLWAATGVYFYLDEFGVAKEEIDAERLTGSSVDGSPEVVDVVGEQSNASDWGFYIDRYAGWNLNQPFVSQHLVFLGL
jgi:hypothetical protein